MRYLLHILLLLGICPLGASGPLGAEPLQLSLSQALELADQGNPELKVAEQGVEIVRTSIAIAGQRPNPTLGLGIPIGPAERKQSVVFTVPLETGGRRQARLTVAEGDLKEAALGNVQVRQVVLNQARNAFVELAVSRAALTQVHRDLEFLDTLVDAAKRRFEDGEVAEAEVIRAVFEGEQVRRNLYPAENRVERAVLNLNRLLGQPLSTELEVVEDIELFPTEESLGGPSWQIPDLATLQEMARQQRPDLALNAQQLQTAGDRIDLARANQTPNLSLQAGLLYNPAFPAFTYQAGFLLELPWGSDRSAEVDQARAFEEQTRLRQQALALAADHEVRLAWTNFQTARQQLANDLRVLRPQAELVLELAGKIYEYGQGDITEVIVAGQAVQRQRQISLQDVAQLHLAIGELELAVNSTLVGVSP